jgi:hypothetical protein
MKDAGTRKMFTHQTAHTIPCPAATSLTTATKYVKPQTSYLADETTDSIAVSWDGVIVQPPLDNSTQPASRFAKWSVHSLLQIRFDLLQGRTHTLRYAVTLDRKPAMLSRFSTLVSKTKKVERLWRTFTRFCSTLGRIATKLDQASFTFVELQTKLGEPRAECFQTRRGLAMAFETDHKVIRITYDNHILAALLFPPPLDPQVKHIMKVDV